MSIREKVEAFLGEPIVHTTAVGGGCIANAQRVETASGSTYFLKSVLNSGDMFLKEANGLRELAKANAIRVPNVLIAEKDFLLMEFISTGSSDKNFQAEFGRKFAQMHRYHGESFGFFEDNFIGATVQKNIPEGEESTNWTAFYFNKRLLFQFKLAEKRGLVDARLRQGFSLLENKIDSILRGSEEKPSVLHGDLWGGNYMIDSAGQPVLIDPAVYYGHREADLAMTRLFGGFHGDFYASYNEAFPLPVGWHERENIYKLYHIINHLNLFGSGYLSPANQLLWSYL